MDESGRVEEGEDKSKALNERRKNSLLGEKGGRTRGE